ncbi:TniQ family protein [Deinococcus carri]|uniref:TniQ family protein n=1 Tax=Deinococcus carri TaxID=1211323 RepID=UPI0031E8E8B8
MLQSRPIPVPGQSLPSYLETLAAGLPLPIPLLTALFRTGLIDAERVEEIGPAYGIDLEPARLREFARLTRLDEAQVRGMLLSHYHGVALDLAGLEPDNAGSVRRAALDSWAFFDTSWICPRCVAQTRALQVSWRLPLHFACLHHRVLHADTCPTCGKLFGHIRQGHGGTPLFASQVPRPGHCWNAPPVGQCRTGRLARPCGFDLARARAHDLTPFPRVLAAQHVILGVLDRGRGWVAGRERTALEYVGHLRSVAALLLYGARAGDLGELPPLLLDEVEAYVEDRDQRLEQRISRREREGGRGGPTIAAYRGTQRSAALMAAVLTPAVELLAAGSVGELAERLAPLVERARAVKQRKLRLMGTDFHFEGPLAEALDAVLAPRAGFDIRVGSRSRLVPPGGYRFRAEHVPQLLWLGVYRERFAPLLAESSIGEDYARRVVSMALVKLTADYSWVQTAEALDLPRGSGTGSANKVMGVLNALGRADAFAGALHALAATLHGRGDLTDYAALRRRLEDFSEVPWDVWCDIAGPTQCLPGKHGGKNRFAAAYVWAQATGGDWRLSPALRGRNHLMQRDMYRRFEKEDLMHVQSGLDDLAADLAAGENWQS